MWVSFAVLESSFARGVGSFFCLDGVATTSSNTNLQSVFCFLCVGAVTFGHGVEIVGSGSCVWECVV